MNSRFILPALLLMPLALANAEKRDGKAVYETSPEQGMKISDIGLKNIEVTLGKVAGSSSFNIPLTGLVYFQDNIGIYRVREGWFKFIKIKLKSKNADHALIESADLRAGDQFAIHGADLLRVAELDAFGGGE